MSVLPLQERIDIAIKLALEQDIPTVIKDESGWIYIGKKAENEILMTHLTDEQYRYCIKGNEHKQQAVQYFKK